MLNNNSNKTYDNFPINLHTARNNNAATRFSLIMSQIDVDEIVHDSSAEFSSLLSDIVIDNDNHHDNNEESSNLMMNDPFSFDGGAIAAV
jgi:cytochrome c biogenesis protein ResB